LQLIPNSNLAAENVIAYETGYRAQVNHKLDVDGTLFFNHYDHLVVDNTLPGLFVIGPTFISLPLQFQNGASGNSYGFELSSDYKISERWKLTGAYTYLHLEVSPDASLTMASVKSAATNLAGQSPRHQLTLRSSHDLPRHLQLDLIGRYVDHLPGYTPSIPSYVTADVRLAWKPRDRFSLYVVGQNLLHKYQQEAMGDPVEVEVPRSVSAGFIYRW